MQTKKHAPAPHLPAAAFSADGYIISQKNTAAVPYGLFSSDFNGCGWIAAYNLLKAAGKEPAIPLISQGLASGSPLCCGMGTGPLRLRHWLAQQGFRFKTAKTLGDAARIATGSPMGILMYSTGQGLHYVTWLAQPGGRFRFLNAIDGAESHICTFGEMLESHARLPLVYQMAVV